jgi:hypothetical protein
VCGGFADASSTSWIFHFITLSGAAAGAAAGHRRAPAMAQRHVALLPVEWCVELAVETAATDPAPGAAAAAVAAAAAAQSGPPLICPVRKYAEDILSGAFLLAHPSGFIRRYAGATSTATHQIRQLHPHVVQIKHCVQYDCVVTVERESEVTYICAYHNWRRNPDDEDVDDEDDESEDDGADEDREDGRFHDAEVDRSDESVGVTTGGSEDGDLADGGGGGSSDSDDVFFDDERCISNTQAYQLPLASLGMSMSGGGSGGATSAVLVSVCDVTGRVAVLETGQQVLNLCVCCDAFVPCCCQSVCVRSCLRVCKQSQRPEAAAGTDTPPQSIRLVGGSPTPPKSPPPAVAPDCAPLRARSPAEGEVGWLCGGNAAAPVAS